MKTKRLFNAKGLATFILAFFLMVASMFAPFATTTVQAAGTTSGDAYTTLVTNVIKGEYVYLYKQHTYNFSADSYKCDGGGYVYYYSLWNNNAVADAARGQYGGYINESVFNTLTSSGKKAFLTDVLTIANAMADDTAKKVPGAVHGVTDETVSDFVASIENTVGMGTTMLTSILQNTKPNYTAANRIYAPFSGVVGTLLAFIAIMIMSLLGVSMALDLAYLTIPPFNMMCTGNDSGGQGQGEGKGSTIGGFISKEAKKAYKAADGGEGAGGQGGSGEYKAAVGIYFKYRWIGLLILGICLLYLVQGQIYTLIAWVIDLVSGFLEF